MLEYANVEIYQTDGEIKHLRKALNNLPRGVIVEIGVYQGASAKIIKEELPDCELYLFDTFTGLPDKLDESDCNAYYPGHCMAGSEYVKKLMKNEKKVKIIEGIFPESGKILENKKIAFVHLDVDIYSATIESLNFLKDKMVKGGRILIHDYPAHIGVKKAIDEFGMDIEIIGVEGRQGLIRF